MDVGIVGGSGYGGAELLRLLDAHPVLKPAVVAARGAAGRPIGEVFPHLPAAEGVFVAPDVDALARCDLVFLATPHEASLELAPALVREGTPVVDLSAAFRLDAATFEEWYGLGHAAPSLAPARYGLPELFRTEDAPAEPNLVANPGCYPTATLLALAPLAGVVDPSSVVVAGMSGTSGAGKGLRDDLHASHAIGNVTAYGIPRHRHTPEIEAAWARLAGLAAPVPVVFTPHLVPMVRGLVCTVTARLDDDVDDADLRARFAERYANEPFVRLLPPDRWPASTHVAGGNGAHVNVRLDVRSRTVIASCAIDNLGKGAAGQALQNANLLLGLPEETGLSAAGVYP